MDHSYISKYSKGTKPESFIEEQEFTLLKEQSSQFMEELVNDLKKEAFTNFNPYTTSFGVELNGIDDAIKFLTMHEALHLGYVQALKKVVS